MRRFIFAGFAFMLVCQATAFGANPPSFQGLGIMPGYVSSSATAISADGTTVVGFENDPFDGVLAFKWTSGGGMIGLGFISDQYSIARDVSGDGSVIVGLADAGNTVPVRWSNGGAPTPIGFPSGIFSGDAFGCSNDGTITVGIAEQISTLRYQAFRAVGSGSLATILPADSSAEDVSGDGVTIVGRASNEAFRWTQGGGVVGLGFLSTVQDSIAKAVSADGSVIVGSAATSASQGEAFRWTLPLGMVSLGIPGTARAISDDGSLIGGDNSSMVWLWDSQHGMRDLYALLSGSFGLNLTGWSLNTLTGISGDGTVLVGEGVNPAGAVEAWIAHIPEPGTIAFVFVGLALVRRRTRHCR